MKPTFTFIFLLVFCNAYGQKYFLNRIDTKAKFKYEYWFQFENIEDSTSFIFEKKVGYFLSTIQLCDNQAERIMFATMNIKNWDSDTIIKLVSDQEGLSMVELRPGKYSIEVSAIGYDKFSFDFTISDQEYFDLKIKLGLAPELNPYQINSKDELTEQ